MILIKNHDCIERWASFFQFRGLHDQQLDSPSEFALNKL